LTLSLKRFVGSRDFYKTVLYTTVPIVVQNSITNFISLLDNLMVGSIGTEQMTGVAIVNKLLFVLFLCIFGAVSGPGLFTAQFYGKGDEEGVRRTFRFKLLFAIVLGAIAFGVFYFGGEKLISLYIHGESADCDPVLTMHYAKKYLLTILIAIPPMVLTPVYVSTLRECGRSLPPMVVSLIGVGTNLSLNSVLIFGLLGFPRLGVVGAAIATVVARYVECTIIIAWTHLNRQKCPYIKGVYRSFSIPLELAKRMFVTGVPLLLNETLWAAGMAALLQCYSYRGTEVVAAMNISNMLNDTFAVFYISIGTAISILVGQRLGAADPEGARDHARKLIALSVAVGVTAGVLLAVCSPFFPYLYNTTPQIRTLATKLTIVVALASPMHALLNASYFTIRSGGKTGITFLFDSGYVWAVSFPLAFCLMHFTPITAVAAYLICQLADGAKCILGTILVSRGIWVKNIVSDAPKAPQEAKTEETV
jgi:putative MATE family efflux protein